MSEDRKDEFESNDPDKKPAWEPLERMGQEPPAAPPGQGSGGYEPPRSNEDGNDEGGCGLMVAGAFVSILFTVLLTPMTLGTGNFGVLFIPPRSSPSSASSWSSKGKTKHSDGDSSQDPSPASSSRGACASRC